MTDKALAEEIAFYEEHFKEYRRKVRRAVPPDSRCRVDRRLHG